MGGLAVALAVVLGGCGQKGPLFLPAQAGKAATHTAPPAAASAPDDGASAAH